MNKPITPPQADQDIGPLDEHGQQIWSAEEEAAIARVASDPDYMRSIEEALSAANAGKGRTHAEHVAWMTERKQEWRAQRG